MTPGQVYAHVGQPFTPQPYDVAVLGAGRMGCLVAHFLLHARPDVRLLLLDKGGLPNEEGATILAPGVWTALDVPAQWQAHAETTRALALGTLAVAEGGLGQPGPNDAPTLERGLIELLDASTQGSRSLSELRGLPAGLADPSRFAAWREDVRALTYSVASLTLRAGQSAVRQGADLMLNAQAVPAAGGLSIDRLTVTNTHRVVVHETHQVAARQVVIAAGADGPALAEQHLGFVTHHAQAYRQWPRLNLPSTDTSPIVCAQFAAKHQRTAITLRPHAGGYTVVTPIHHRDPHGYQPIGGRLSSVPVGLRREVLQDLLLGMEGLPALATEALEVGRSLADIPGAWVALPAGGWPLWEALGESQGAGYSLLLGGEKADLVGAGVAREAARDVLARL